MRKIENKANDKFTTAGILLVIARNAGDKGITWEEANRRIRLLDVLEGAKEGETLDFEDEDWKLLTGLIKNFRFAVVDRELQEEMRRVLEAPAWKKEERGNEEGDSERVSSARKSK